jgi:hypothetical protein
LRFTAEQADNLKGLARTEFEQLIAAKQAGHLTRQLHKKHAKNC